MHQARVRARPLTDHPRSYPAHHPAVRVDDTDTWLLAAAARELEAHLVFEQARQVADARALLAELYEADGVAVEDAVLDAQAEDVARLERADRFLHELPAQLQPDAELLAAAASLDDHTLLMWEEAAANLAEDCPPTLAHLRWPIEETRRGELRSHAQLVRAETQLAGRLGRFGLARRLWRRRHLGVLGSQLADCQRRRQQAERRLALLETKLAVLESAEQARMVWIAQAREMLVRGWPPPRSWPTIHTSMRRWKGHGRLPETAPGGHRRRHDPPQGVNPALQLASLLGSGGGHGGVPAPESARGQSSGLLPRAHPPGPPGQGHGGGRSSRPATAVPGQLG
jgi:hypothetical protein